MTIEEKGKRVEKALKGLRVKRSISIKGNIVKIFPSEEIFGIKAWGHLDCLKRAKYTIIWE